MSLGNKLELHNQVEDRNILFLNESLRYFLISGILKNAERNGFSTNDFTFGNS